MMEREEEVNRPTLDQLRDRVSTERPQRGAFDLAAVAIIPGGSCAREEFDVRPTLPFVAHPGREHAGVVVNVLDLALDPRPNLARGQSIARYRVGSRLGGPGPRHRVRHLLTIRRAGRDTTTGASRLYRWSVITCGDT